MKNSKILAMGVLMAVSLVVTGCGGVNTDPAQVDMTLPEAQLASCITEKGYIFMGTERCSHCKDQKKRFGDALPLIDYVDCDKNKSTCTTAGVQSYPTRVSPEGELSPGGKDLVTLSQMTGCEYTPSNS